ncbi:MAG TPA: hypothetical protein DCS29_03165 [Candidatus Magasanikbacteria bacterium]|nr:MAG: hypothetical protein A2479_01960 [Candidatus Magasanikbacteria bacterium RIFOXYC2_FULL_39_8]HAT03747.1 hypothetical protein [Candidatus Magasanikbacteria bacterium]
MGGLFGRRVNFEGVPLKQIILVLVLVLCSLVGCATTGSVRTDVASQVTNVTNHGSFIRIGAEEGIAFDRFKEDLRSETRPVLVIFGESWCPACGNLEEFWAGQEITELGVYTIDLKDGGVAEMITQGLYEPVIPLDWNVIPVCVLLLPGSPIMVGRGVYDCGEAVLERIQFEKDHPESPTTHPSRPKVRT